MSSITRYAAADIDNLLHIPWPYKQVIIKERNQMFFYQMIDHLDVHTQIGHPSGGRHIIIKAGVEIWVRFLWCPV